MGFFRQLFGTKKAPPPQSPAASPFSESKPKKRWGFPRSRQERTRLASQPYPGDSAAGGDLDAGKHAIAVAAATAAVAEAALVAAHAAAEVVRLTNSGAGRRRGGRARRWGEVAAAVKIQSAFRGYLARRALRALRALVKLQAVVRGHIVRKQTADMVRRMQTLVRVQARARAGRANTSEPLPFNSKTSKSHHPFPASPDKNELRLRAYSTKFDGSTILKRCGSNSELRDTFNTDKARTGSNWLDQWMEENLWNSGRDAAIRSGHADDEKSEKILEVDTWRPRPNYQPINRNSSQHHWSPRHNNQPDPRSDSPSKHSSKGHNPILGAAENSPRVYARPGSSSARRDDPSTPVRSECSWSYFSGYSNHPNYMSNTESFCAKVRSQSAPRQRIEFDKNGRNKRSGQGSWDAGTNSERSSFALQGESKNKGSYLSSSCLTRNRSANLR